MSNSQLIGILGGTFDPIHCGHLELAQAALQQAQLQQVHFIPCNIPPHRTRPEADAQQRLQMTTFAIQNNPNFVANDCEIRRGGLSFMVDTLHTLKQQWGEDSHLCLIMGEDSWNSLDQWSRWPEILHLSHILLWQRIQPLPPSAIMASQLAQRLTTFDAPNQLRQQAAGLVVKLALPPNPISSTAIRTRCHKHQSIHGLVPQSVENYILQHQLYIHFNSSRN